MITRYAMSWATDEDEFVYVSPIESAKGNWVKWEDYARLQQERVHDLNQIGGLQQELARLRASSFVTAVPVEEYEKLKAEVERLNTPIWLRVVAWIVSFVGAFWLAEIVFNWMHR